MASAGRAGRRPGLPVQPRRVLHRARTWALAELQANLRSLDPQAKVVAFLDDIYVVVDASHSETAVGAVQQLMTSLGMELRMSKTALWTLNPAAPVPPSLAQHRVSKLTCLGSVVPYVRDDDGVDDAASAARMPLLTADPGEAPLQSLKAYSARLRDLRSAALTAQSQLVLLRTYANGAVVHLLRANHVLEQWCVSWDNEVVAYMQELLHRTLRQDQQMQVFLPLAQGGLGFASASAQRRAAFLGARGQSLRDIAPSVGVASA